jgi:hypothetical protein
MISKNCEIKEFIEAIQGSDNQDAILLADSEATEVERQHLRMGTQSTPSASLCGMAYATHLKNFIYYIRYGVRPAGASANEIALFQLYSPPRPGRGGRNIL